MRAMRAWLGSLVLVAPAVVPAPPSAPGTMVLVSGHRMHFLCRGSGAPTIVVENGLGDVSTDWSLVQQPVSRFGRICTYDRAGYAWSEPGPMPRTFDQLNLELHEGLKALGETGPFVLVGHSFGGPVVRHYASLYPAEVAGMVLVDTVQEDQRIPMGPRHAGRIRDGATGRPVPAARLEVRAEEKVVKSAPPSAEPLETVRLRLSAEDQRIDLWAGAQPALAAAEDSQKEWSAEALAQLHATAQRGILGAIPVLVLARARGGYSETLDVPASELDAERLAGQRHLAELSSNSALVLVPSGHEMHLQVPEVVAEAIQRVVTACRGKRPLDAIGLIKAAP
jgi:pimeloyl-ACP methyl ester carboxylesterase